MDGLLDTVPLDKIFNGSGWAVAFWAVLYVARLVYSGRLVPQKTHEATVEALRIERQRSDLLMKQLEKATDSMETFEAFVRALPQPATVQTPAPRGQQRRQPRPARDRAREWGEQWDEWNPPGGERK